MLNIELTERAKKILNLVIDNYIKTGEPVGSSTLVSNYQLPWSPATVRSVLSELMDNDYLYQPHVSAGRAPTEKGIKYYIDSLLFPQQLSEAKRIVITKRYQQLDGTFDEIIYETSIMLSDISNCAGLATLPSTRQIKIKSTELIKLADKKVLVMFVFEGGMTEQRLIRLNRSIPKDMLRRLSDYINKLTFALTLAEVETIIIDKLKYEKQLYREFLQGFLNHSSKVTEQHPQSSVFIKGQNIIFDNYTHSNPDGLRELIKAFDEKSFLLEILGKAVKENSTIVFLGSENGVPEGYSLIAAPYGTSKSLGTLGVFGPLHMDYSQIIPLVDYTAKLVSKIVSEGR
ncbi:heat-inducible transcriptional repressor HrcA [Desulfobacterota bacterium AH_259_B03_O07]|nr:heat-inducible transcriptional repressor HrcA [Desulfobacterota bacterium AH_259_B03_O07]